MINIFTLKDIGLPPVGKLVVAEWKGGPKFKGFLKGDDTSSQGAEWKHGLPRVGKMKWLWEVEF